MGTDKADNTNTLRQQAPRNGALLVAILCLASIISFALFIAVRYYATYVANLPLAPILGITSMALLLAMAGFYFYAYSFYADPVYLFFAIGWIGNAAFILLQSLYVSSIDVQLNLFIAIFTLLSFLPFYIAGFITPSYGFDFKKAFRHTLAWAVLIILSFYLSLTLQSSRRPTTPMLLAGMPWTMWTLIRAGTLMRLHMTVEAHSYLNRIFPATFLAYASLQPLSIFQFLPTARLLLSAAFATGLVIKIVNCVSLVAIMQRDFAALRERLGTQTILEELGILTASIEHDIKNPLQIIANDLAALKERFQSNPQIVNRANRIEEQRRRIYAATEIIRVLRGGEYYDNLMSKVSINQVLQRAVRAIKEESAGSKVLFKVDGGPKYTRAYEPALQQVFVNIFMNAVEAIADARRQVGIVTIQIEDTSVATVLVRITDNGCGIRSDDLPKLGKFFSTKKDRRPNSGIGLFISQRILTFHKGRMELDSVLHERTTVSVFLPSWQQQVER